VRATTGQSTSGEKGAGIGWPGPEEIVLGAMQCCIVILSATAQELPSPTPGPRPRTEPETPLKVS
jgi:hypothetical protein